MLILGAIIKTGDLAVRAAADAPYARATLISIADATVLQGYPDLRFGTNADMWAGYDTCLSSPGATRSMVKFDLAPIPAGGSIITATLRLNVVGACGPSDASAHISTHRVISDWAEASVTWNTKPEFADAYGGQPIARDGRGWYEFDVTELARAWWDGTHANHGVMIVGSVSGRRSFSTHEGSFAPELVIEFSAPLVTDTPTPPNTPTPSETPTSGSLYLPFVLR